MRGFFCPRSRVSCGCRVAVAPYPAYRIHYARIEPWSKLLILPRMGEPWGIVLLDSAKESGSDGGGGRITQRFALRPSGRCLRQRFLATLESNLGRSFSSFPALKNHGALCFERVLQHLEVMVVGEGFEPSKSMTADLQSAPFGRSGTPPRGNAFNWPASCWKRGASYQMRRPCKAFL